jgi:Fimbrial assembly protein (PilN)
MVITGFNLAASDYRRNRRTLLLLAAATTLLILLVAGQLLIWGAQRRANQAVEARLAGMETEFARHQSQAQTVRAKIPAETVKQYEARVAAYNQILEASAFSWIGLLVELERSVPPGVTVSSIQPDLSSGKVALLGETGSFENLTKLLRALEQRAGFRDVFLLHQATRKSPGGAPEVVDFSVSLIYEGRPR